MAGPFFRKSLTDSGQLRRGLEKDVQHKAIEIANSLLEDGYEEGRAIPIAIAQAKKVRPKSNVTYQVAPVDGDNQWEVRKEGADRATNVFNKKQEALDRANELIDSQNAKVMIHRQDGTMQETKKANN
ncbi:DUF2188 domain-containing protein [Alteribacter populi]|uniref:DUF2188 domain-containing protein n=1 Tax=Alteribacter populi TaxID=2011011 RepID=UPI001E594449|nr:DUF2188 domain-containing protein [Alteribacter populi]